MASLSDMIRALKKLGKKEVEAQVAKYGADAVGDALRATLSAGESPEGQAWAPKKEGGGKAYAGAPSKLETKAYGALIRATISGGEVYGHFGAHGTHKGQGKKTPKKDRKKMGPRPMLPDGGAGMPQSVEKALIKSAQQVLDEALK